MRTDLAAPYDWINNIPDPNSADCRNVIAWMIQQGAPPPKVAYIRVITAIIFPTVVPAGFWVLQFAGMPYPCDLALSLNSPTLVLQELDDNLHLNLPVPSQYTPPAPPQPPPAPVIPLPQPSNPVGAPMVPETGVGSDYFPAPGDTSPVGTLHPSPVVSGEPVYQKIGRETPWGTEIFWQRIA